MDAAANDCIITAYWTCDNNLNIGEPQIFAIVINKSLIMTLIKGHKWTMRIVFYFIDRWDWL